MLFLLAAGLTLAVVVILVRPLLRDLEPPPSAERYNAAVYRDQLEELQREAARETAPGAAGINETAGARLEIERRLLSTLRQVPPTAATPKRAPVMVAIVLAGVLALGAGAIYLPSATPQHLTSH